MKRITLISLVGLIIGVILLLGGMSLIGFDFANLSTARRETTTHEIPQSFDNISIEVDTADVRFAAATDGKCKIVCHESTNAKHTVSVANGTLSVQNSSDLKWYDHIGINTDDEYVILYLPTTAYNTLSVVTDTGDVEMPSPFTFQNASIETDTGDVEWKAAVASTLSITVDTGDIEVENISVNNLTVESDTGDAELSSIQCQTLSAKTNTGDVECTGVVASEKITIETDTGDVELNDCDAAELWIKTSTGDVSGRLLTEKEYICNSSTGDVRVPDTTGGKCEITTDTGDIYFR